MIHNDKKIKAIMIVHGIGEQESFDTLFDFYEGIYAFLGEALKREGANLKKEYEQSKNDGTKSGGVQEKILQNLRLQTDEYLLPRDVGLAKEAYIDIFYRDEILRVYEVWWAKDFVPPKILGVFSWLLKSAIIPFKKGVWSYPLGILTVSLYIILSLIYLFILIVYCLSKIIGRLRMVSFALVWLKKLIEKGIIDLIGDVEVYINKEDEAKEISGYLKKRIKGLLDDNEILELNVVGHSLGSVITYETLCDLTEINHPGFDKIKNYITAGSPLDKIRYFFGKSNRFNREIGTSVNWINYYATADLVAARLDYFKRPVENVRVVNRIPLIHCQYWKNLFVIKNIVNKVFTYELFDKYPIENKLIWGFVFSWGYAISMFLSGVLIMGAFIYLIIRLIFGF